MPDPIFLLRLAAAAFVALLCWHRGLEVFTFDPEPGDWKLYLPWFAAGAAPIFLLVVR